MPVAERFLAGGRFVDGFQGQSDFDQFFARGRHGRESPFAEPELRE